MTPLVAPTMRRRGLLCGLLLAFALNAPGAANAGSITVEQEPIVLGQTGSVTATIRIDEPPGSGEDRPLRLSANVGSFGEITKDSLGLYRAVYVPPTTKFPQVAYIAVWRETGPDAPIELLRLPLYGRTRLPLGATKGTELTVKVGEMQYGPVLVDQRKTAEVPVIVAPGVNAASVTAKSPDGTVSTRDVEVTVPPYNRLTAALVPHAIAADGKSWARLEVYYEAAGEQALPPSDIQVTATVGTLTLIGAERGRYTYRYIAPVDVKDEQVQFSVSVASDPAASARAKLALRLPPPARLVLRTPDEPIAADGRSKVPLTILVLDEHGLGLTEQKVEVDADANALAVEEVGNGAYRAVFPAPARYPAGGLVRFEARVPGAGGRPLRTVANYQLKPAAAPAAILADLKPAPVPADGRSEAMLTLELRDSAGRPLSGQQLMLAVSDGTIGELSESGAGIYQARYVAPTRLPAGDAVLRVVDSSGTFERKLPIPLRESTGRLLLGVRGGFWHNLGRQFGPRVGLDAWAPLRLRNVPLAVGLSASYGQVTQTFGNAGGLSTESEGQFVPIVLRVGAELYASRKLSVTAGAGGVLAFASMKTSLTGQQDAATAPGALGFGSVGYVLGPGQAFFDLSYCWAPIRTNDFRLDAGGLGAELGYRVGVF